MPEYITACPRNCYSTCTMKIRVTNGRLRMIEPHPGNLATPEGVCLKGLSYIERVYSPDRILYPLVKNTSGKFERISWADAFQLISSHLIRLRDKHGPQSILYYTGSGTKGILNQIGMNFWRLFGGCTATYGDLCWPAGLEATRLTLGENKHNTPWDLANAKLIIMWGKNPAETNIHQMLFLEQALEKGSKLVVIDPRRTQSSEQATLFIQPRPGTDGALALAVANLLINANQIDHKFINRYVAGFKPFAQLVRNYSGQRAAEICEIPESQIDQLAELIAMTKPVTINAGFGMQRYTNSGQTMRAIIALLALTGNIGKPGSGWIFANLQSHIFNPVKDPIAFYPPVESDGVVRISISTSKLGTDILNSTNPPVKMIWVERGNPVTQNPDTNKVRTAFRSLEYRVVIDQFLTDTAQEADLVLPAKTMFEQTDIIGAYWHPYIQLKQKVIESPGEVKPESEIYYLLARQLGFEVKNIPDLIPSPGDDQTEHFLNKKLEAFPGLSIQALARAPILAPGNQEIAFCDFRFATPSGKIELLSLQAEEMWGINTLPDFKEPEESVRTGPEKEKYPLYFLTPNTKNSIHSQFNNLKLIRNFSAAPSLEMHPSDAGERNIKMGDSVRIYNDRGELIIKVTYNLSLKKGCVALHNGWWIGKGGTVNFCSFGRETDIGYGAAFHDNLVQVEALQ